MRTYSLIGAGGTGTILLPALERYLDNYHRHRKETYELAVIDGDTVSQDNLIRQFFAPGQVADNKAQAIVVQLGSPDHLKPVPNYIGKKNIEQLVRDKDTILIAVDNYPVRAHLQAHALTLDNINIINGGNEEIDGSCQLFIRNEGRNITPPITHCHPEITVKGDDRAKMNCQQIAALPGGGQTLRANMMSATQMLNMLSFLHAWEEDHATPIEHEIHFDLRSMKMRPTDNRGIDGWT